MYRGLKPASPPPTCCIKNPSSSITLSGREPKNLTLLTTGDRPDIGRILRFEQKYREQVAFVHSHIKPPHFDSGRRVPIDELFVAPRIARSKREKQAEPETISFQDFSSNLGRMIVLGNPGGGKSTLTVKLCHDLASDAGRERRLTPLLVILREFGSQKKGSRPESVIEDEGF